MTVIDIHDYKLNKQSMITSDLIEPLYNGYNGILKLSNWEDWEYSCPKFRFDPNNGEITIIMKPKGYNRQRDKQINGLGAKIYKFEKGKQLSLF